MSTISSHIENLTEENFDSVISSSEHPVVIDFWAPWCGPCQAMGPVLEEFADEQQSSAVVAKVDIDNAPNLAQRYGIRSIPSILVFKNGEVVSQSSGVASKADLIDQLKTAQG